jgi:tripartite-type tricarboxylate transporter receptor subunit TctC
MSRISIKNNETNMQTLRQVVLAISAILLTLNASVSYAQYPESPVKMIVGFPPGQATDVVARYMAQKFAENLPGSTFIVDNRAGASGILGSRIVAAAVPDGLTLMMGSSATLAVNPALYKDLPYDVLRDFAPISLIAIVPQYLVVNIDLPVKTVKDLVELAKKSPGQINYGSGGSGVTNHLIMELFKQASETNMTHVPYKGGPAALTDLMAGRISAMFETGPGAIPLIQAGRLRAIAVSSAQRAAATPDIPTVAESGYPGFQAVAWIGLVAPAKTPESVINTLSKISMSALREKDFAAKLAALGAVPVGNSPSEFRSFIEEELKRWAVAVKLSGAKVD